MKYDTGMEFEAIYKVAPHAGAWIEMDILTTIGFF